MTVTTDVRRVMRAGNGLATEFAFSFPVPDAQSVVVKLINASGASTELSSPAFEVELQETGGLVRYPLSGAPISSGESIIIERVVPLTQTTDLTNQGAFFAETHEDVFDRTVMMIQQIDDQAARAIRLPVNEAGAELPPAAERASKFLGFDSSGRPVLSEGVASGEADIAAAISDVQTASSSAAANASSTALNAAQTAGDRSAVEALINALPADIEIQETAAELQAIAPAEVPAIGRVWNDPLDSNNGDYINSSGGTNNWVKSPVDLVGRVISLENQPSPRSGFNTAGFSTGWAGPGFADSDTVARDPQTLQYQIAAGNLVFSNYRFPEAFGDAIYVTISNPVGTFATASLQQLNTSSVPIAGTTVPLTQKGDLFLAEGIDRVPDCVAIRINLGADAGGNCSFGDYFVSDRPIIAPILDPDYQAASFLSLSNSLSARSVFNGITSVGRPGTVLNSDGTVTTEAGLRGDIICDAAIESGTDLTCLMQITGDVLGTTPTYIDRLRMRIQTVVPGGAGEFINGARVPGTDYYVFRGHFETGAGAPSDRIFIEVGLADIAIRTRIIGIAEGLAIPAAGLFTTILQQGIEAAGLRAPAHVDPNGDDANSGSLAAPVSTVAAAIEASDEVLLRVGYHRLSQGLTISDRSSFAMRAYSRDGDEMRKAVLLASTEAAYPASANSGVPNVYFFPLSYVPHSLFERNTVTGEVTMLGVDDASRPGRPISSSALDADQPGAWWPGTDPATAEPGLFVHPSGSDTTAKVLEIPIDGSDHALTLRRISKLEMDNVEVWFGHEACISFEDTFGRLSHVFCRNASRRNGFRFATDANVALTLDFCGASGCFEDGCNTNGKVIIVSNSGNWSNNYGDGASPHGVNNVFISLNERFENNAKIGFPDVSRGGYFRFTNVINLGNTQGDFLFDNDDSDGSDPTYIELVSCTGHIHTTPSSANNIAGRIIEHEGPMTITGNLRVERSHCSQVLDRNAAIICAGGNIELIEPRLVSNLRGVRNQGAVLSLRGGTIVNNTHAQVEHLDGVTSIDTAIKIELRGDNKVLGQVTGAVGSHVTDSSDAVMLGGLLPDHFLNLNNLEGSSLPTSDPMSQGEFWNQDGFVRISAG